MKPVYQTKFGCPEGNCLAACLASVLEISIEEVEQEYDARKYSIKGPDWFYELQKWLFRRGLCVITFNYTGDSCVPVNCYHIVGGKSHSGDWGHAVVYFGNTLVHDPNPNTNGLKTIEDSMIIASLFPKINETSRQTI